MPLRCTTLALTSKSPLNSLFQHHQPDIYTLSSQRLTSGNEQYFLNLCSRNQDNSSCWDTEHGSLGTFACQNFPPPNPNVIIPSTNLGSMIGFEAISNPTQGLRVLLTQGSPGCAATHSGVKVPRYSNISMICDLTAGVGSPMPNNIHLANSSCAYNFVWRSLYACPVCTPEDYDVSFTECIKGMKVKTLIRKSPCWDPSPVPPVALTCQSCPKDKSGNTCSNQGVCDEATGLCGCELHWAGSICASCSVGFFSPDCSKGSPSLHHYVTLLR